MSAPSLILRRQRGRALLASGVALLLLAAAAVVHLGLGARPVSPRTVLTAVLAFDPRNFEHQIIVNLRLLRLVAALLVGAALGVAGALLQSVIRNPLGEPHILGLNAGAALAVVVSTALGLASGPVRPLIAAAGAGALFALVMGIASAGRVGLTPMKVTLSGVALTAFTSSITAAVLILDEQTLTEMRIWLAGDLAGLSWAALGAATGVAGTGFALALWISPALNMLTLGDQVATGLGVSLARTRMLGLIAIALLCGAAVSLAGPIGFIGLIVPHLVRCFATDDLRPGIPLCALTGALLLTLADIAARTLISPQELATGVMTALVGAPLFILLASRLFK
ncbi:FecCD family ABC transporter permease [Phytobacter sp. V91]|uniref:FecCD family ABC transporter permease n=1 Tax=Phytobacter sp. V91 TaxID=3369425 RepID=UPI003F6473D2